jgi:[ribosomal protein S5]-alanine N-acetyltransferase
MMRIGLPGFFTVRGAQLDGRRVFLRPPRDTDWRHWADLRGASRDFLTPWEPVWPADALGRAAFRRRVRMVGSEWREDLGYSWLLFRRGDGALLGGVTLSNVRRGVAQSGSLGYWIGAPHARRGYMTEALQLLLPYAFERLGLHRIEAACLPNNAASRSLLRKLGFVEEGYAREYLRINGSWQDHVLYGLLKPELRAAAPQA